MAIGKFDPSTMSYEKFIRYFFTTPGNDDWDTSPDGEEFFLHEINHPEVIVRNLTRFCNDFRQLSEGISVTSLDRGIKGMLSAAHFELQSTLWDDRVDLDERILCIRSMYRVFSDFVASCEAPVLENCFYGWWDYICTAFWFERTYTKKIAAENYDLLAEGDRKLMDAMFETLVEILRLDDGRAQIAALHGLGHLRHPGVRSIVQKYIDTHGSELKPAQLSWLEKCREGTVM